MNWTKTDKMFIIYEIECTIATSIHRPHQTLTLDGLGLYLGIVFPEPAELYILPCLRLTLLLACLWQEVEKFITDLINTLLHYKIVCWQLLTHAWQRWQIVGLLKYKKKSRKQM